TAPLEVREKVAFAPEQLVDALEHARASGRLREIAILSTCNRTELYCSTDAAGLESLLQWLGDYHHLAPAMLA
ncbi:glutamyl-tRNA reductase, partial [Microbulbifer sp. OS29]|nr:glutamyl-tRNA reductase [Microbulbifer okhotskensis]